MQFRSFLPMSLALALVTACASQTAPNSGNLPSTPPDSTSTQAVFLPLESGGVWHPASKGKCPSQMAEFDFLKTSLFNEDGTDVACQYGHGDGTKLTIYFYQHFEVESAQMAAQLAGNAIVQTFPEAVYLDEESRSCTTHIDLMAGLSDAMQHGTEETRIEVGRTPCFVFDITDGTTAVATDLIGSWHLKLRITGPQTGTEISELTTTIAEVVILERGYMSGTQGIYVGHLLRPDN